MQTPPTLLAERIDSGVILDYFQGADSPYGERIEKARERPSSGGK